LLALAGVLAAVGLYSGWGALTGFGAGRGGDCRLTALPGDGAPISVRAECDWSIPVERLRAVLEPLEAQALHFSSLEEATVLGVEGDTVMVRQLHRATGISDREVVVEWNSTPIESGWLYSWRKCPDQSAATGRGVEVERYEGSWEITATESGSHVVLETRWAPGGSVPFFLVHWFRGSGIRQVLSELSSAAESEVQVASGPPS
jgi:hypothetical protein